MLLWIYCVLLNRWWSTRAPWTGTAPGSWSATGSSSRPPSASPPWTLGTTSRHSRWVANCDQIVTKFWANYDQIVTKFWKLPLDCEHFVAKLCPIFDQIMNSLWPKLEQSMPSSWPLCDDFLLPKIGTKSYFPPLQHYIIFGEHANPYGAITAYPTVEQYLSVSHLNLNYLEIK